MNYLSSDNRAESGLPYPLDEPSLGESCLVAVLLTRLVCCAVLPPLGGCCNDVASCCRPAATRAEEGEVSIID